MKRLRNWLIGILGGLTEDEAKESGINSYEIGRFTMAQAYLEYAKSLYGKDSQQWNDAMWAYIEDRAKEYDKK